MERILSERIHCQVPFCRRTIQPDFKEQEWLCSVHWPLTQRSLRKLYFKRKRRFRRGDKSQLPHMMRIWDRLKMQAIERAAGI